MEWDFEISYDRRPIRLRAKIVFCNEQTERILVQARNKYIVLQSNRPFLESRGLKQKRIDWKIVEGTLSKETILFLILRKLESKLKQAANTK